MIPRSLIFHGEFSLVELCKDREVDHSTRDLAHGLVLPVAFDVAMTGGYVEIKDTLKVVS